MDVRTNGVDAMYYVHTDHLGSLSSVYNASGSKVAEQSFDPWGRQRNPSNWTYTGIATPPAWLIRGYTGHEQLPQFGLINMNARLYDPLLAHVVSPDNYVQFPDFTQRYNRFSYCINNPLKYTDPSGNYLSNDELDEAYSRGSTVIDVDGDDSESARAARANGNQNTEIKDVNGYVGKVSVSSGGNQVIRDANGNTININLPEMTLEYAKANLHDVVQNSLDHLDGLYQFSDNFGQILNAGGVAYGGAEMGLQAIRQGNGAQVIGRTLGFGTQRTAQALKGTLGAVSKFGKGLGVAGYGLQFALTGSKFVTGQTISKAEGVGFGISTVFVGAAVLTTGTIAAPFVAGGVLIYGAGQLGSWMITGNTLEENYFGK